MPHGIGSYKLARLARRLLADRSGASAIEYGMLIALLSVALMTSISVLGDSLTHVLDSTAATLGDDGLVQKNPGNSGS